MKTMRERRRERESSLDIFEEGGESPRCAGIIQLLAKFGENGKRDLLAFFLNERSPD